MNKNVNKRIRLFPTEFYLDLYVNYEFDDVLKCHINEKYDSFPFRLNEVVTSKSKKGEIVIVLILDSFNFQLIVHEITHVLYHLDELCNLGTSLQNQEWIAYFNEYLFKEIVELRESFLN